MIPTWSQCRPGRRGPRQRSGRLRRSEGRAWKAQGKHRSSRGRGGCSKFQHGKIQNSTNNCWFEWGKTNNCWFWWGNKDFGWFWYRKTFQISSSIGWTESLALAYRSEVPDEMCWAVGAWLSGCPVDCHPFSHWRLAWLALSPFIKTMLTFGYAHIWAELLVIA